MSDHHLTVGVQLPTVGARMTTVGIEHVTLKGKDTWTTRSDQMQAWRVWSSQLARPVTVNLA
jgi:hypothetical protein